MKDITVTPRRDLGWSLFDDGFDNLFGGFFRPIGERRNMFGENFAPPMDVTEHDDNYVIKADLPGIKKDDIHIQLEDGILTISGETREEKQDKSGDHVIRQERCYGKYLRTMSLNHKVDENNVKATYHDGVLELVLPKLEESKPKKISIEVK